MLQATRRMLERTFRRSAMWAYALNQSRARVLLDPVYLGVAKMLLRNQPGPSPRLLRDRFPANLFLTYRAQSRKLQYFIEDWDWDSARPELLTPRQRQMMHTVALGETSGSAVADGFLRCFRTDPELAAFFGIWFTEELNHFIGYHLYLKKLGEAWPPERGLAVAEVEFRPYADDPMEVAACNMYQELVGFLIYRSFARQVKDPFLKRMLAQFAKDECRHFRFYQDVVARHIQRHPDFRAVVLKVFLKATSPYNQISGSASNVLDHLAMGSFYFRKAELTYFLDQVEYLLGTRLHEFWDWYFTGVNEPCTFCGKELHHCSCESYEDERPPAIRNPGWWRQVTPSSRERPQLPIDEWTAQLLSRAATRSAAVELSG